MLTKAKISKQFLEERMDIPPDKIKTYSRAIIDRLISIVDWPSVKSLHTYVPIERLHEIDTWSLLKYVWSNYPTILTAVPGAGAKDKVSSIFAGPGMGWNMNDKIPQPISGESVADSFLFDLIIVPFLAFDNSGHRVGYGGGYYDRFLFNQTHAITIGLGFEASFIERGIPYEDHDVPLKRIVTEKRLILCRK